MHGVKITLGILIRVLSSLAPRAVGDGIADQKFRFFCEFPELSGLRVNIPGNLCTSHAQ